MEAKYINPFFESFLKTLGQFGVMDVKRGNIRKKDKLYVDLDVTTVICLKGNLQGNVALSMNQDTAKKLVSAMMMGMGISVIDDMAKSAIGEFSSIMAGTASTMIASLGIKFQISPPIVLLEYSDINPFETLAIDFETQIGKIELNVGFNMCI